MCRLTDFGTISSDDREQYGTRVSLGQCQDIIGSRKNLG